VDPYYLTHKAQSIGYHPEVILAGRRINDGMGAYVASQLVKAMTKKSIQVNGARILIMGLAFKENCPDVRNTKVVDIYQELLDYNCHVDLYDPWINPEEARNEYGVQMLPKLSGQKYEGIILAVAHQQFKNMGVKTIRSFCQQKSVLYDLKYILSADQSDLRL
jgi:UDP-N-acetyl-D-galactosamine dehydrogenase